MRNEILLLLNDEYRYASMLEHLTQLAKQPGVYEYATQRSRELARTEPEFYGKLPADLWQRLKKEKS